MNADPYSHMGENAYRMAYLIAGYIRDTLTEQEHQELDDWVTESDRNMQLFEDLTDESNIRANLEWMDRIQAGETFRRLEESGAFRKSVAPWIRKVWPIAASIVLVAGVLIFYSIGGSSRHDNGMAKLDTIRVGPGSGNAILTLPDGSVIDLTEARSGSIFVSDSMYVRKPADGELVYDASTSLNRDHAMHVLSTPTGGQYRVTLPDGSRVWLNAASHLKYPSSFVSNERKVEIIGEAYFEVAKNDKQPFIVLLPDSDSITVLGTHFNVMSYPNESEIKITLVEGRVAVASNMQTEYLESGTQATIVNDRITRKTVVNIEQYTAWKDGLFVFHDASIEAVMKQLERWYGIQTKYNGPVRQLFNASISRSEPLSTVLHLLELNGYVNFKIENKIVHVFP